jgi:hypothetical protein
MIVKCSAHVRACVHVHAYTHAEVFQQKCLCMYE